LNNKFTGVFAALLTPYTTDGKVNQKELKKLVRKLISQNIDGFYVGGSTAETFLLSNEERKLLLETVVEENNHEKTVIAHVGHISTDVAIDLALHAQSLNVDAVSAISPFYYKFTLNEIKGYYFDIMDTCNLPMFVYNFPDFSGFSLTNEVLSELCNHNRLTGVKFTSSDFYQLERMKTTHPGLVIWNGFDEMFLSGLAAGADGGVGSTYNCICPIIRKIYDHFKAGNIQEAYQYQQKANHVIEVISRYGVFASEKTLLEFEGIEFNGCRRPFAPLSEEGRKELRQIYDKYILPMQ